MAKIGRAPYGGQVARRMASTMAPYMAGRMVRGAVGTLAKRAAGTALRAVPYVGTALNLYDAARTARRLFSRSSQTAKRTKQYSRSYYAGKRKARGYKIMRGRKYKRYPREPTLVTEVEAGGSASGAQAVYLNGATIPLNVARIHAWAQVVRKVATNAGQKFRTWDEFIEDFGVGAQFIVYYRAEQDGVELSATVNGAAGITYRALLTSLNGLNLNIQDTWQLTEGVWVNASGKRTQCSIAALTLTMYARTHVKFQNRSVNELNDQNTDTIDRCPVRVRVYFGNGNCPMNDDHIHVTPYLVSGNATLPVTSSTSDGTASNRVLPRAKELKYVTNTFDYVLDPGAIKNEQIISRVVVGVEALIRKADRLSDGGILDKARHSFGNFKLVGFEKLIGNVSGNTQNVTVTFEGKSTISSFYRSPREKITRAMILTSV